MVVNLTIEGYGDLVTLGLRGPDKMSQIQGYVFERPTFGGSVRRQIAYDNIASGTMIDHEHFHQTVHGICIKLITTWWA